ncbi:2,3-bisphosphoglycerate-independent phosphoglycerate mutase [Halomarina litorea]|uniref:2,3-bisphosphoglycerate-independent phosphoglycerate mutase n=1 Tax=Halomarina litorea TaxID=2961595 RepID=UPI0020C4BF0B|nr:2,3-bisphosphoglycerate-independent phosphoglycerate mutase [Halomarina sp. BCD28]
MRAALVILDGWGLGVDDEYGPGTGGRDAVSAADTPTVDDYRESGAFTTLSTHGRWVGLPDGQMGNSEVGHLTIGAGRVVKQDSTRISDAIESGDIAENEALGGAFDHAREHGGQVHFMGLVSDGGVHSLQTHLHALVELAADRGIEAVTHAFTDGRDTAPKGGTGYLRELEAVAEDHGTGHVATVCGRYYAMDRDTNWERTKRAYDAIVHREAPHEAASAVEAVESSYERGETDEFVEPTLVAGGPALDDGDSIVFVNFRSDRARQLVRMLGDVRPEWEFETDPPDVHLVTMTEYDETFTFPVAFPPTQPADTLGEVVAGRGWTQARLAESEKYAHVTYFLNGGREVEFDGERRRIVESPDVPTYDQQPEMSAPKLTDTAIEVVETEDPDLLVLNYANADMVGHTGDFDAAVAACEAVDEQVGRLVPALREAGAAVMLTADHGNADDMGTPDDPHTAHTTNPVPAVLLGSAEGQREYALRDDAGLAAIAPTLLELLDIETPEAMTGESMLS